MATPRHNGPGDGDGAESAAARGDDLADATRRQALLFDALLDAVVITDVAGKIVDWNRAAERLYGYSRADVLGKSSVDVLQPSAGPVMHQEILQALAREGRWEGEVSFVRSDGTQGFTETVVIAQRDAAGKLLWQVGVNRDVTERKRAEAALRRSEEQLRQAQKMEAVGRLAGGVAHEFNNLLAAIRGNAELALTELSPSSPARDELEQIRQAADAATAVARQLLSFSRQQATRPKVIDLGASVERAAGLLRRLLRTGLELVTDLPPDVGHVRLDLAHLEQILINLALNARDAMPGGGRLTVAGRRLSLTGSDTARPSFLTPGEYLQLSVSDTGGGIDPAARPRIFEPFFTTRENASGLGLFTVYGIVSQNGGSISVESAPGAGTTFSILFPRVDAVREEPRSSPEPSSVGSSETILLVEDEAAVRRMAERLLERRGYRVLAAADAEDALRLQAEHDGPIDLLLTDMTMPGMGGLALAARMAALRPRLPIVFMSGYTEDPVPAGLIGDSPTTFVQKPFSLEVLAGAVRQALEPRSS